MLDTSNLVFIHPPRNVPLTVFESPISPIIDSRVCDDCWDQIHGCPSTPRSPDIPRSTFRRVMADPTFIFHRSPSSLCNSPISISPTLDKILPPSLARKSHPLRDTPSSASLSTHSSIPSTPDHSVTSSAPPSHTRPTLSLSTERSYGELDTYPLRRSSVVCKATGGGRWEPKQITVLDGYRIPVPGGKAPYEIQMERDEMLERERRANPVVKDGDFQYRFLKVPEPLSLSRSPRCHSTF